MGQNTKIEWAHHTANLWWGCQEVHEGCDHCYARTWDKRMGGNHWGARASRRAIKSVWTDLARWQQAAQNAGETHRVFCGSMMDIFEVSKQVVDHKGNPLGMETADLRDRLFHEVVPACPNLLFLFLTKRPQNIRRMVPATWLDKPPTNTMYGYSAVNQATADQGIPALLAVPGRHFLSMEPLLGPTNIGSWLSCDGTEVNGECCESYSVRGYHFQGVDWVIVGGESGHGARPMHPDWARSIRDECREAGVPYFFKQWGEWMPVTHFAVTEHTDMRTIHKWEGGGLSQRVGKAIAGRLLDGVEWSQVP